MKASYHKYILQFKQPSGTSRGVLTQKETYFIVLQQNNKQGIGECGILRGLSFDDVPDYEQKLQWVCNNIQLGKQKLLQELVNYPSIQFGLEQAFLSVEAKNPMELFPSAFTKGQKSIPINGLVWMGSELFMKNQIEQKIKQGFTCIKMKIGAIDFDTEFTLLKSIRQSFSPNEIEIRVDANGAFSFKNDDALKKLEKLATLTIHSIEQPIKPKQWENMAKLCELSPLPIALDEELIGVTNPDQKKELLQVINPQYIILKPSLVGGINGSTEWITFAEHQNIGWWVTSALESNIGLNAIAQWTFTLNNKMYQGLGTGSLFTNNFESPLLVANGCLHYQPNKPWSIKL